MGTAGNLRPHQRRLGMKHIGIDLFQPVSALVVVAVACGGGKAGCADLVLLHGVQHLALIDLRAPVNFPEARLQPVQHGLPQIADLLRDSKGAVHLFQRCHGLSPLFSVHSSHTLLCRRRSVKQVAPSFPAKNMKCRLHESPFFIIMKVERFAPILRRPFCRPRLKEVLP